MLPNWKQTDVVVNGAHFNIYQTPEPLGAAKPVLVLQHGLTDNGLCWGPVAAALAADYDILMPDARGHGRSARVAPGEDIDQAADLAGLLGALGVPPAVVAGHSMGAQIAASLAARFPELATAIILEDPPWFLPRPGNAGSGPTGPHGEPMSDWLRGLQAQSLEQVMAGCQQEHPTWPEAYVRAWCQGKQEMDINFLTHTERRGRWQDTVPAIQCPALLITANPALGSIVTPEVASQVTALNPRFQVVNFPEAGHHVRFAMHPAYLQAFTAFLHAVA